MAGMENERRTSDKAYGYIYKIEILDRDAYYIGMHKSSKFDEHYWGGGNRIRAYRKKHGEKNLKRTVLAWANSAEELRSLENFYIGDLWKTDSHCWNCCPGGQGHTNWTLSFSERLSISLKKAFKNKKKIVSDKTCIKLSEAFKKLSQEKKYKRARNFGNPPQKGKKWCNNGLINKHCFVIPEGFKPGRIPGSSRQAPCSDSRRLKERQSHLGKRWYNDGVREIQVSTAPPEGFKPGRLKGYQ